MLRLGALSLRHYIKQQQQVYNNNILKGLHLVDSGNNIMFLQIFFQKMIAGTELILL